MLAPRLDEALAQTDPFELAQAAERYVRALPGDRIRELIREALPRMSEYYAAEFSAVAAVENEASLRVAFARSLKSNLRAIPLFGRPFGEAVLAQTPSEGAIGFGDQRQGRSPRSMAAAVVACAFLATIIGGVHYVTSSRAQVASAMATPNAALVPAPPHVRIARARRPHKVTQRIVARPTPVAARPVAAAPPQRSAPQRILTPSAKPMPVAHGEAVVAVPSSRPRRPASKTPAQTAALDTSDMPQPYSDATPLPDVTAAPALTPQHAIRVSTPVPAPKRRGWFHRTIMHLDPFKPNPHPQSTP